MGIWDLLFPPRCVSCNRIGFYCCPPCRKKIEFIDHPICPVCQKNSMRGFTHPYCRRKGGLDGLFAACRYSGPVKTLIHEVKYRFVADMVDFLIEIVWQTYPEAGPALDLLVPVPLHPARERERGFNQSLLLAQKLSRRMQIPVYSNCLIRTRKTRPQAELVRKDRSNNIRNAFKLRNRSDLSGYRVGIVDDVCTTGFTLMECAKILKASGAREVWGVVVAHGD